MRVQMQALQDGLLMRYCSGSTERATVQQFVADFAMSQLRLSVETPDLLFQTSNEATAAWCYRVPEQLVSSDSHLNTAAAADWLYCIGGQCPCPKICVACSRVHKA